MKTVMDIILSINIKILGLELTDFFGLLLALVLPFIAIVIVYYASLFKVGRILLGIGVGVWVWVCHGFGWGIVAGLLSVGLARVIAFGRAGK